MKEKNYLINYVVVALIFVVLLVFLYTLNYTKGKITGNIIQINTKPLLVISELSVTKKLENSICNIYINGVITNKGGTPAENAIVRCFKPPYPESSNNQRLIKTIGFMDRNDVIHFEISFEGDCNENPRFECIPQ